MASAKITIETLGIMDMTSQSKVTACFSLSITAKEIVAFVVKHFGLSGGDNFKLCGKDSQGACFELTPNRTLADYCIESGDCLKFSRSA